MECQKCKGKLQIKESYYSAINDTVEHLPTEVYHNSVMACMNDKCENYGIVTEVIKSKLDLKES